MMTGLRCLYEARNYRGRFRGQVAIEKHRATPRGERLSLGRVTSGCHGSGPPYVAISRVSGNCWTGTRAIDPGRRRPCTAEPERCESSGCVVVFKHAGTAGGSCGVRSMRQIQVSEVWDLHKYAEEVYVLDQPVLTKEFDSAVGDLIRCWDNLCNLLEEHGRQAAERRETVDVEGLNQREVLEMTTAAVNAIDSARRHHMWEYWGDLPNEREIFQSDVKIVGLLALKRKFNEFLDQERRNHRSGKLPDPLPSPVSFEIRDGAVHKAPPPTPAPPDERRADAESAWTALKELLADLAESSAGQNHPRIGRMLDRCRAALGDEFQQMDVVMLGVHASRLDQIARRVDEILMPEDAANLVAFNAQLGLFLGQFPEWSEYARGIADRFGSDEAEQKAVSDASEAVQAMRNEAPDLLAPDAVDALTELEEDATPETDADGQGAFTPPASRRSYLRANRNLFLKLSDVVVTSARKGVERGIERHFEAMTIGALSAASISLLALAAGLPAEFGWLSGIATYLVRILGAS